MNKFKLYIFLILIISSLTGEVFPVNEIMINGDRDSRINIVFLGDGYTQEQMGLFINDVNEVKNELFNQLPYQNYNNFFNIYAIEVPSNESGTDHPGTAPDCGNEINNVFFADTYFDCAFDQYNIHRLVVIQNYSAAYDVLADNLPEWDIVFVMVNHTMYGGSGGTFATFTRHSASDEIAIHEIGHTFPGLADEYWAGFQYANENANMSQEANPDLVRWNSWMYNNGIGIYDYEAPGNDWHRPHQNCKMRYLGSPFCSVCIEQTILSIYNLVNINISFEPSETTLSINLSSPPIYFSTENILPEPNTLEFVWYINDLAVNSDQEYYFIPQNYNIGSYELKVEIIDNTDMVRNDPNYFMQNEITWMIEITGTIGDVNSDYEINILDIVSCVSIILNNDYQFAADLNSDQEINILDVILLVAIILNH